MRGTDSFGKPKQENYLFVGRGIIKDYRTPEGLDEILLVSITDPYSGKRREVKINVPCSYFDLNIIPSLDALKKSFAFIETDGDIDNQHAKSVCINLTLTVK